MKEPSFAYSAFNSSAATAVTLIADFFALPRVDSPRVDLQRIARLERLTDELERGLSDAKQILEETPPLAALKDLKSKISALREKYAACLQYWRKEGGQERTPPILWGRVGDVDKALKRLYQDVCDHIVFAEAEEEETITMPPGKVEDLVRTAHQEKSGEDSR